MTSLVGGGNNTKEGLNALKLSIWDQGNQFLRRLLNIFDMQKLARSNIGSLLEIVDGLRFLFGERQKEVADLSRDLKVLVLNAEQKKFCEELKGSMERETWTASKFGKKYTLNKKKR